jgi:hypothetical protein
MNEDTIICGDKVILVPYKSVYLLSLEMKLVVEGRLTCQEGARRGTSTSLSVTDI